MAKVKEDIAVKYQTTKNGEVVDAKFSAGDEVTIVQTWKTHYLVKDGDGHYFNIPKDKIDE